MPTIYFHFDVEANGYSPAKSSMLELGICVTDSNGTEIDTFNEIISERTSCPGNEDTIEWLKTQPATGFTSLYDRLYNHPSKIEPVECMKRLEKFVQKYTLSENLKFKIIWVASPAAYDWMWVKYYWDLYIGTMEIGYSAKCLSTTITIVGNQLGVTNWNAFIDSISNPNLPHTHCALDDARSQAYKWFKVHLVQGSAPVRRVLPLASLGQ
jgi:hypothetical protein